MAQGSGTRPWKRGNEAARAVSATVIPNGDLIVTDEGNVYAGDGVKTAAQLPRVAFLADAIPPARSAVTNARRMRDLNSLYDASFPFEAIWANSADGHLTWSNLTIDAGFGGQVGQGGAISYFKVIGGTVKHRGPGNFDGFWMSVKHEGTREAGLFIGDIHGDQGGNVYGSHFYVKSTRTAPAFMVGGSDEIVPQVARSQIVANTAGAAIAAGVATTSVTLGTPVQLTTGTNISFVDANAAKVTCYVASDMASPSTTVPVKSFTSSAAIASGSAVQVGVNSAYFGRVIRNSGNQTAGSGLHIEAPEYTGDKATTPPFLYAINLDASAGSALAVGIKFGGAWATGIDMNGTTIVNAGSIVATGTSPNRDARLVDNLLLDNSRHIKFRNAAAAAVKTMGVTSSDNFRFIAPGPSKRWEGYDSTEATLLWSISGSGRADFSVGGFTTKYTSAAAASGFLTNGYMEVWHDSTNNLDYLMVHTNGTVKKVAVA